MWGGVLSWGECWSCGAHAVIGVVWVIHVEEGFIHNRDVVGVIYRVVYNVCMYVGDWR